MHLFYIALFKVLKETFYRIKSKRIICLALVTCEDFLFLLLLFFVTVDEIGYLWVTTIVQTKQINLRNDLWLWMDFLKWFLTSWTNWENNQRLDYQCS